MVLPWRESRLSIVSVSFLSWCLFHYFSGYWCFLSWMRVLLFLRTFNGSSLLNKVPHHAFSFGFLQPQLHSFYWWALSVAMEKDIKPANIAPGGGVWRDSLFLWPRSRKQSWARGKVVFLATEKLHVQFQRIALWSSWEGSSFRCLTKELCYFF